MIDKNKILLDVELTLAEKMTNEERESYGIKELTGMIAIEASIKYNELEKEYQRLMEVSAINKDAGLKLYIDYVSKSMESAIKGTKKTQEIIKRKIFYEEVLPLTKENIHKISKGM